MSTTNRTDDELMLLASAGRRDAFSQLVSRYLPRLTSFCGKFVGDVRLGEELAQDTLLHAWAERRRYTPKGRFAPFLFTLARNLCRNHVRDRQRRGRWHSPHDELPPDIASAAPAALEVLLEQEQARRIHQSIAMLPEKIRDAVLLRFDQGLDYADIGEIVGCPEVTARSRVFHGLKHLRASLAPENLS